MNLTLPRLSRVVLFGCAAALGSCAQMQEFLDGLEKPTANVSGARLADLSMEGLTLDLDVDVANPYPVALPVADLAWTLASKDQQVVAGSLDDVGSIPAGSSRTIAVPIELKFAELMGALQGVRPGTTVPYVATLDVGVDVPGGDQVRLPLRKEGTLPVPAPPTVQVSSVAVDQMSLTRASGVVRLAVGNPNDFPFTLNALDYAVELGGTSVAESTASKQVSFEANQSQPIDLAFDVSAMKGGSALLDALRSGEIRYAIRGDLDLETPFGPIVHPYANEGRVPLLGP